MAPATCMLRVCTYVCIVIDMCFCVVWDVAFQFELEWLTGWSLGCVLGWLAGGQAVSVNGWPVGRLYAWIVRLALGLSAW